jgi:hypothetical protein
MLMTTGVITASVLSLRLFAESETMTIPPRIRAEAASDRSNPQNPVMHEILPMTRVSIDESFARFFMRTTDMATLRKMI